jgi:hypothetical protein
MRSRTDPGTDRFYERDALHVPPVLRPDSATAKHRIPAGISSRWRASQRCAVRATRGELAPQIKQLARFLPELRLRFRLAETMRHHTLCNLLERFIGVVVGFVIEANCQFSLLEGERGVGGAFHRQILRRRSRNAKSTFLRVSLSQCPFRFLHDPLKLI